MGRVGLSLTVLGLAAAAPLAVLAATPPAAAAPAAKAAAKPAEPDPSMIYYPPGAKAAGIEGKVILRCGRNEHLALVACALVSETPTGQGFGAAALAMAAKSPDNPKVDMAQEKTAPPQELEIDFSLHPPVVDPDVTLMTHVLTNPTIVTQPTHTQIQAAYPVRALSDQVEGGASLICTVTERGSLDRCRIAAETPAGYGFGQAALELAPDYVLSPAKVDGDVIGGRQVRVGVPFTTTDPDAPLSLDTKPPPK